jgi:UDP-GlcNAc3NAcA epimerase
VSQLGIMTVVGARPEFIKAAPLSRALAAWPGSPRLVETLVHTGQHYDLEMAGGFFDELDLSDPVHLGIGSGSHGAQTGRALELLDGLITARSPGLVVVYGDTNSTLAGALAAAKLRVPVAHVEAGLRSWNPEMPEEINRRLTDHLATLLFCPSARAVANLEAEGIKNGVTVTGDVNLDAMLLCLPSEEEQEMILTRFGVRAGEYALATVHRAENTDRPERLAGIIEAFRRIAAAGLPVLFPAHPRTTGRLRDQSLPPGITLVKPAGFRDLLGLARQARVGLTDSGGVQKELFWLGTPCVTLRHETEWVETLEDGRNVLAGTDPDAITRVALADHPRYGPPPPVYGEGHAAEAIVQTLAGWATVGA